MLFHSAQATTGKDLAYTQFGKPHRATYDFAQKMLERHLKEARGVDHVEEMHV
jgi:ribonucleotide monophosphatase NagD (HAD superfamily)